MAIFKLVSDYKPCGDQPKAIRELTKYLKEGLKEITLLGVTGSGKTFTIANVIKNIGKPTLVISHNKTLVAQLYSEFKQFFPENKVEYFVSYYDYYQPEAYLSQTDTYIEKDASINEEIEKLRFAAVTALLQRNDVIIVATVSCIYGLDSPANYKKLLLFLELNQQISRDEILHKLVNIQYERNDYVLSSGKFRVRGNIIEVYPSYLKTEAVRIEFFGEEIKQISIICPLTGKTIKKNLENIAIYPAKHFVVEKPSLEKAIKNIKIELKNRVKELKKINKLLEAKRLETRTTYDLELLRETGYCHGIENYSRHLTGRKPNERPACLIDYFPEDFLTIIDESHVTLPQLNGMYRGDLARKKSLVEHGFRLKSAFDNRPLKFWEFKGLLNQIIYLSATPSEYELKHSKQIVEQIIRPTGLLEPKIIVKKAERQIDDLIQEIKKRAEKKEKVLVTSLTKKMAEDLADYLTEINIRARYLHSDIQTFKRVEILKDLRNNQFDCLVGVNLLREGLDLPEVSLVAILDADKEGFLRSKTSLIQMMGRASRNISGEIILYTNTLTSSIKKAIKETNRRRKIQIEYNKKHKITPKTIQKAILETISDKVIKKSVKVSPFLLLKKQEQKLLHKSDEEIIEELKKEMLVAASALEFEKAAEIRDYLRTLIHS